jgi:hypothetical protein
MESKSDFLSIGHFEISDETHKQTKADTLKRRARAYYHVSIDREKREIETVWSSLITFFFCLSSDAAMTTKLKGANYNLKMSRSLIMHSRLSFFRVNLLLVSS